MSCDEVEFDVDDDCSELSFIEEYENQQNQSIDAEDQQESVRGGLGRQKRHPAQNHHLHPNDEEQEKQRPGRNILKKNSQNLERLERIKNQIQNKSNKIENRDKENLEKLPQIEQVFLYKPGLILGDLHSFSNLYIEIRIDTQYLSRFNKEIIKRNLWGSRDSYSSNSDAAAMAIHANLTQFSDPHLQLYRALGLICKVSKARKSYTACISNNIKTRALKGYNGHALKPQATRWLSQLGSFDDLTHYAKLMASPHIPNQRVKKTVDPEESQLVDRKQFTPIPEYVIVFNMVNEPAYKYSLMSLGDKSDEILTSMQLIKECIYLEAECSFFQISMNKKEISEQEKEVTTLTYRVAQIKEPLLLDNDFMREVDEIPLTEKYVEVIFPAVGWEDFRWASDFLMIQGGYVIHQIKSYKFYDNQGSE